MNHNSLFYPSWPDALEATIGTFSTHWLAQTLLWCITWLLNLTIKPSVIHPRDDSSYHLVNEKIEVSNHWIPGWN